MEDLEVKKYKLRKNDYLLRPWEYRTYLSEYVWIGSAIMAASVAGLAAVNQHLFGYSLMDLLKELAHPSNANLHEIAKVKLGTMFALSSSFGFFCSKKMVKPKNLTKISAVSEHYYYSDLQLSTQEFHKQQNKKHPINFINPPKNSLTLVSLEECKGKDKIYQPIQFNANASILAGIGIGIAGSGKSAFLTRFYEQVLTNRHKLIVHAPDSKAREMIVASGFSCMVSAPWTESSIYIDLAATLNVEDMNLKNALIDLVITSFFGVADESDFFANGAVFVLTASLRKLCSEKSGIWTLDDWKNELISKTEIWEFKAMVDTYYPEAAFTISEEAEKMTASIIASITKTLVAIGRLALYYSKCRKPIDIRKWCIDDLGEHDKQCIILCSDTQYEEVSRINIALFVNLTIPFLLSSEREKCFNKNGVRVYQALDEFPNFARNIDTNKWIRIVNEGRKFGNSALVIAQNTPQFVGCFPGKNATSDAKKFVGSFHYQIIAQPGPEDESFIQSIVGEITWEDTEAVQKDQTYTTSSGATATKIITKYETKLRKEPIAFKRLQTDLGMKMGIDDKGNSKPIGVVVAIRMFETQITAPLFFPFVNEFAKKNRDDFRHKIVVKNEREFRRRKDDTLQPLFYFEKRIILTQHDERQMYCLNELNSKIKILEGLLKNGKLKQAKQIEEDIIALRITLNIPAPIVEVKQPDEKGKIVEEKSNEVGEKIIEDSAAEALDHTGVASTIIHVAEMADEILNDGNLTKIESDKKEIPIDLGIKKKKSIDLEM